MSYIDGYADYLVEATREKLGYDVEDNSHDDEVLAKLTSGEKLSKSKHIDLQTKSDEGKLAIEKLDELQRAISVRKVEISEICYHEKVPKPSFNDLDWVIEQIYWLKKTIDKN